MISASLSLSLPRLGWKSTSTPRSLKICTAAGESASEMRTLGLDIDLVPSPPEREDGPRAGVGECLGASSPSPRSCGEGWGERQPRAKYKLREPLTRIAMQSDLSP